jgi:hypothetical protein
MTEYALIIAAIAVVAWGAYNHMGHDIGSMAKRGIPSYARVSRTDNDDCSTSRMISNFSAAAYLIYRPPHPRARFF